MKFVIRNTGLPLEGRIPINGAKNATLPIMAAALLTSDPVVIHNVPNIGDVRTMAELLRSLGASVTFNLSPTHANHSVLIHCQNIHEPNVSPKIASKIRASFVVLGPLLSRLGRVRMPLPGGCDIGLRGIDLHVEALEALGAHIRPAEGNFDTLEVKVSRLRGSDFTFSKVSVGASENALMAAVLAQGHTVLRNVATEPDVTDLAQFLVKMGARIQGIGTKKLSISGVGWLSGCDYTVIPDRHEAGTYALAALITGGRLELSGIRKAHLSSIAKELGGLGGRVRENAKGGFVTVKRRKGSRIKAQSIATDPYPKFPTDMQPQFCTALTLARGTSIVHERVFESRVSHVEELAKLGADICCVSVNSEHQVLVRGTAEGLSGTTVVAGDLRAGAALVLAGLVASGETVVHGAEHVLRGYEAMDLKLNACGASVHLLR